MKAMVVSEFGDPQVLKEQEVPIPIINDDEVLIRVQGAGVNFADIKARKGKFHGKSSPPFIPGLDVTGMVESVGAKVTNVKNGEKVIAFPKNGSYAEYTVANSLLTYSIPDSISSETAAAFPVVSVTAYYLLTELAKLKKGETVLIHSAAGGIGTTAIQLAKHLGAGKVIGTVGSDHKLEVVRQVGGDYAFNYKSESIKEIVKKVTNNEGVDVVLDSIGGEVFEESMECLTNYGRIVNVGNSSGKGGRIVATDLHSSCRSILGFSLGTTLNERPQSLTSTVKEVIQLVAEQRLSMHIHKRYKLTDATKAHQWIESKKSTGKIVLIP